jgi:hypothetical protein
MILDKMKVKTELLEKFIESAKTNRKGLEKLKQAVVACQQFELASELRAIELDCFPETEEVKKAKSDARLFQNVLAMVDLKVGEDVCWLIMESVKEHSEKGLNFSIKDAAKLKDKQSEIYPKFD